MRLNELAIETFESDYLKKYLPYDKFEEGKKKLDKGISPQYIVGNVDFYGNIINVDDRVLIPRFETELLVEKTVSYINKLFNKKVKILDMGTGSGCIAISLKKLVDCDMSPFISTAELIQVFGYLSGITRNNNTEDFPVYSDLNSIFCDNTTIASIINLLN